jgi:hypothetical protein
MTTQPARPSLALVPEARDEGRIRDRGETITRQWNPEAQLVGALMHLPVARAAPILNLVPDSAIWRPDNRWATEIIRHLVAQNTDPDPVIVLHTARCRGPADERSGRPISARRHHRFAAHLADLYTNALSPVLVRQYAREVLEDAFRRTAGAYGGHLNQLAESGADRNDLAQCVSAMRAELAEWWRRTEAAARPSTSSR